MVTWTIWEFLIMINPRMVRGLDYYTHTAFEYKAQGIGAIDTIGGGGRYNGLVSQIGGRTTWYWARTWS